MTDQPIRIPVDRFKTYIVDVLHANEVPIDDAAVVADCLLMANLSGIDSHGVVRLAHYVQRLKIGSIKALPDLKFEQRAPALGYVDGDDGLGHVVSQFAVTKTMELAADSGIAAVSVGNSSHFGMAAFYSLRMAEAGLIGICMTPTDRLLVPFGARKPFFGSNPICFGFPNGWYAGSPRHGDNVDTLRQSRARESRRQGDAGQLGTGRRGQPCDGPGEGCRLVSGSRAERECLAMVIDILGSVLANMPWGPHISIRMYQEKESPRKLGHLFIAIDVARFMPLQHFKDTLSAMLEALTTQEPADGFSRVNVSRSTRRGTSRTSKKTGCADRRRPL